MRRELREGDAVGNHTWDHPHLIVMTRTQIHRSLNRTEAAIFKAAGTRTTLMRPPFGARDWSVMQVAHKMGYTVVMWSVPLARDWEYPPPKIIAQRVLPRVRDGSIVVLHDGNRGQFCAREARALCDRSGTSKRRSLIVEQLKRQGYRFVTIPELIT